MRLIRFVMQHIAACLYFAALGGFVILAATGYFEEVAVPVPPLSEAHRALERQLAQANPEHNCHPTWEPTPLTPEQRAERENFPWEREFVMNRPEHKRPYIYPTHLSDDPSYMWFQGHWLELPRRHNGDGAIAERERWEGILDDRDLWMSITDRDLYIENFLKHSPSRGYNSINGCYYEELLLPDYVEKDAPFTRVSIVNPEFFVSHKLTSAYINETPISKSCEGYACDPAELKDEKFSIHVHILSLDLHKSRYIDRIRESMDLLKQGEIVHVKDASGRNMNIADNLLGPISGLEHYEIITGNNSEYASVRCSPYKPDNGWWDRCFSIYADIESDIILHMSFDSKLGQFGTEERFWHPMRHARDLLQSWRRGD